MKNTRHDIQAASAMLERARQILELTYHDWRLHERHQRRGKGRVVNKQGLHASCDRPFRLAERLRHNAFA